MSVEAVRSKQSRGFDPVNFTVVPPRTFQDLRVGDVFVAFTIESFKFLNKVPSGNAPAPQGDTGMVTTRAAVHNQRGELVLEGEHQYALKTVCAAEK